MELSNEERTQLGQLRNRRFWCTAAACVGVVMLAVAAFGQATGVAGVAGLVLLVGGIAVRAMTTNRIRLVEARIRDRVTQTPA